MRKSPARHTPRSGFASATPTAARDAGRPTSLSSRLVLTSQAPLVRYPPGAYFQYQQHHPSFDQRMIDVGAIRQEHICKSSPVLVLTVSLERDFLAKNPG